MPHARADTQTRADTRTKNKNIVGTQAALQAVVDMELPAGLMDKYPARVRHLLQLARIEFLTAVCGTHILWPHPNAALTPFCDKAEVVFLRFSLASHAVSLLRFIATSGIDACCRGLGAHTSPPR